MDEILLSISKRQFFNTFSDSEFLERNEDMFLGDVYMRVIMEYSLSARPYPF